MAEPKPFAVIKTGGKQYKVAANDVIKIEKLDAETGDIVTFDEVLMVGDVIGAPLVEGALVAAELVETKKQKTVIIFKKRRRHNSRRRNGHRQLLTTVRITEILTGGAKPTIRAAAAPSNAPTKAEPKPTSEHGPKRIGKKPRATRGEAKAALRTLPDEELYGTLTEAGQFGTQMPGVDSSRAARPRSALADGPSGKGDIKDVGSLPFQISDVRTALSELVEVMGNARMSDGGGEIDGRRAAALTRSLLRIMFSSNREAARAAAYGLVATSTDLGKGLDPKADPLKLSRSDIDTFRNALDELIVQAEIVCVASLEAYFTGEDTEEGRGVAVDVIAKSVLPFDVAGEKICIVPSRPLSTNADDVVLGCPIAVSPIETQVDSRPQDQDVLLTAKARFAIDKNKVRDTIPIDFVTPWVAAHRRIPLHKR